jgi:hypothetical protein
MIDPPQYQNSSSDPEPGVTENQGFNTALQSSHIVATRHRDAKIQETKVNVVIEDLNYNNYVIVTVGGSENHGVIRSLFSDLKSE